MASNVIQFQDPVTSYYFDMDDNGMVTALQTQNLTSYATFVAPLQSDSTLMSASSLWVGEGTANNAPLYLGTNMWVNAAQAQPLNIQLQPVPGKPNTAYICVNGNTYLQPNAPGPGKLFTTLCTATKTPWLIVPGASAFRLMNTSTKQYVAYDAGSQTFSLTAQSSQAQVFEAVSQMVFLAGTYSASATTCLNTHWLGFSPVGFTHSSAALQADTAYEAAVTAAPYCFSQTTDWGQAYFLGPNLPQPNVGEFFQTDGANGIFMTGITADGALEFTNPGAAAIGATVPGYIIQTVPLTTVPFTSAFQAALQPPSSSSVPFYKQTWFWVVIVITVLLFFVCLSGVWKEIHDQRKGAPKPK